MPVILDPDTYDLWLDPGMTDTHVVSELMKPYDASIDAELSREHEGQSCGE